MCLQYLKHVQDETSEPPAIWESDETSKPPAIRELDETSEPPAIQDELSTPPAKRLKAKRIKKEPPLERPFILPLKYPRQEWQQET